MAKIAFLGLGQMGAPMAARLLQAGHELTVWNRTPDRAKPLAAGGATVAKSPAEAGAGAAFAITMVATPEALKDVVLSGEHSLVRALGPVRCTSTCRRLVRTPSDRSPPSSRWASPSSTRPSGAASAKPPKAAWRSSSAPATKTSSARGRSSSRSVQWDTWAASAPAPL
jgi:hypothetical protein